MKNISESFPIGERVRLEFNKVSHDMLTKLRSEFNKQSSISSQPTEDTKILLRSIEASCLMEFEKI